MLALWGSPERSLDVAKKPEGFKAFDSLAKQLVTVPKEPVDKKMAKDKAARLRRRAKKK